MAQERLRVCEECWGLGVRLYKGYPGVWKGDGQRTKRRMEESNIL